MDGATPAEHLQELNDRDRWAVADQSLLGAIARNEPVSRGSRGRLLATLVATASSVGLMWPLIRTVGAVNLVDLLLRQFLTRRNRTGQIPERCFVGFGAGKEDQIYRAYCNERRDSVGRLDQTEPVSFARWHSVDVIAGFRSLARAVASARAALAALPPHLTTRYVDFATFVGMRIGNYAYMRAWFAALKANAGSSLQEVAFVSADTAAFASVDAGLPTCYLQHGMIRRSLLLPSFGRVEALTDDEAEFMAARLPGVSVAVHRAQGPALVPGQLNSKVLVASIYGDSEYVSRVLPFIDWFNARNIPVSVRPHPRENGAFWSSYESAGRISIDRCDSDFLDAVARVKPRLVVSWYSTAMHDALMSGVIPVSVCDDGDRNVADMVYPLFRRCLRWPRDEDVIVRVLEDESFYSSVVSLLKAGHGVDRLSLSTSRPVSPAAE